MIQVQIVPIEDVATVLAGVFVALENIVPGELHFLFGQAIENQQHNHARDPNLPRNGRHHFMLRRSSREIAPAVEIVGQEIVRAIGGNHMGVPGIHQGKGTTSRADVNRLPEAI